MLFRFVLGEEFEESTPFGGAMKVVHFVILFY